MGGKKKKIEIEKIEGDKTVTFSKRRKGLFGKAEELCRRYPMTRIAILVPSFAPNSHVPFYNFGHSSVDKVVNTFLNDPENKGSESWFWWEDERFDTLDDLDELNEAADSILMILNKARSRLADLEKSNQSDVSLVNHHHHHHQEELNDLVQNNQRDVSLVNHHYQDELNDLVQSSQRAVSLVNHHHHQEEESNDLVNSNQREVSVVNHHHQEEEESKDLVQSNQRDVSLVNHHHHHLEEEEESNDLIQSNQRDVSLVNYHHEEEEEEEKVLQICKEETTTTATNYIPELEGAMTMPDYIPKFEGETSGSANSYFDSDYLESGEDDQIPDDFFNLDQDLLSSSSCFS